MKIEELKTKYDIVITPKNDVFNLHIKELIEYKELLWTFIRREFIAQYKQTILGPLWAIISPLLTTIVFTIVFGKLAALPTTDIPGDYYIPSFLFFMSGNICFSYFSRTISSNAGVIIKYSSIMSKAYYPRIINYVSNSIYCLISFFIQFVLFIVLIFIFGLNTETSIVLSTKLFLLPIIILHMFLLSLGLGIIISAFTTKYRDLGMLVGFILQLWQYFSPIAYGLNLVNEKIPNLMSIYMLNPFTPIITTFRYAVFGFGYFNLLYYLTSVLATIIILVISIFVFNNIDDNLMDVL